MLERPALIVRETDILFIQAAKAVPVSESCTAKLDLVQDFSEKLNDIHLHNVSD